MSLAFHTEDKGKSLAVLTTDMGYGGRAHLRNSSWSLLYPCISQRSETRPTERSLHNEVAWASRKCSGQGESTGQCLQEVCACTLTPHPASSTYPHWGSSAHAHSHRHSLALTHAHAHTRQQISQTHTYTHIFTQTYTRSHTYIHSLIHRILIDTLSHTLEGRVRTH